MPTSTSSSVKKARANGRAIFLCFAVQQLCNKQTLLNYCEHPKSIDPFRERVDTLLLLKRGNLNLAYSLLLFTF